MKARKTIDLPISTSYVKDWGTTAAIRELFQNALDSEGAMTFTVEGSCVSIASAGVVIPRASLLLGYSVKPEGSIGKFGEGYKLACLALLRLGKSIVIKNGTERWFPRLKVSRKFNSEILAVDIATNYEYSDLTFLVSGLTEEEHDMVAKSNLHLNGEPKFGILTDRPGDVFVSGLFVCHDKELKFGYDFKPNQIVLNRDRCMVRGFELYWSTSQLWAGKHELRSELNALLAEDAADIKYIQIPSSRLDLLVEDFQNKYGVAALPISSQEEAEQYKHVKTVIVPDNYRSVLRQRIYPPVIKLKSPTEYLQEYFDRFEDQMSEEEREEFLALVERSNCWRV